MNLDFVGMNIWDAVPNILRELPNRANVVALRDGRELGVQEDFDQADAVHLRIHEYGDPQVLMFPVTRGVVGAPTEVVKAHSVH